MDWQLVFNAVGTVATLIVTGYVKFVQIQLNEARAVATKAAETLQHFQIKVAENYVTHGDLRKIEDSLVRIEAVLNAKQDK